VGFLRPENAELLSHDVSVSEYKNQTQESNVVSCKYGSKLESNTVCAVDVDAWEPCTSANTFDYLNREPCVFIKLNKVCLLIHFYDDSNKGFYGICTNDFYTGLISS
jgi:hypothetical protein